MNNVRIPQLGQDAGTVVRQAAEIPHEATDVLCVRHDVTCYAWRTRPGDGWMRFFQPAFVKSGPCAG